MINVCNLFRPIDKKTGKITDEVIYMTADEEDGYAIAQASEPVDKNNKFINNRVRVRYLNEIKEVQKEEKTNYYNLTLNLERNVIKEDEVYNDYKDTISHWYYGHFHQSMFQEINNIKFRLLDIGELIQHVDDNYIW